jgi:hypothetical protein
VQKAETEKKQPYNWQDVSNLAQTKRKKLEVDLLNELVDNEFLKSKRQMIDVVDEVHEME